MKRIIQLPQSIANQIAAGEVIERPASVVKELLENALDAGADTIGIEVSYGGLNQIKISDNGEGIVAEDLHLAVSAHATSKIKTLEDLYAIDSLGFRGEALASIASVAKLSISSKPALQDHAMTLRLVGEDSLFTPSARSQGTTIEVTDLFYNAPVRKRFLKSEALEFRAIEFVVKRFALSQPKLAISLKHNGKLMLNLNADVQNPVKRVSKILGKSFISHAIFLEVEHTDLRLYGWVSDQTYQRSSNDKLWVYINGRMVRDKLILHAIKQVYDGLLHPGRFPACLLYFNLPSTAVDVNVHPTKHEVRFASPKLIHDFFTSQLRAALQTVLPRSEDYVYKPQVLRDRVTLLQKNQEKPLTYLNNRFGLIQLDELTYLIDIVKFLEERLKKNLIYPLNSRSLSLPICYPADDALKHKLSQLKSDLVQLGLEIECIGDAVSIQRIPNEFPYLDLQCFLESIAAQDDFNFDILLNLLCQAQIYGGRLLSLEEQEALAQWTKTGENSWCKLLTEKACQVLFYD